MDKLTPTPAPHASVTRRESLNTSMQNTSRRAAVMLFIVMAVLMITSCGRTDYIKRDFGILMRMLHQCENLAAQNERLLIMTDRSLTAAEYLINESGITGASNE